MASLMPRSANLPLAANGPDMGTGQPNWITSLDWAQALDTRPREEGSAPSAESCRRWRRCMEELRWVKHGDERPGTSLGTCGAAVQEVMQRNADMFLDPIYSDKSNE